MVARVLTTDASLGASLDTTDGNPYPVTPADGAGGGVLPPLYSVVLRPGDTSGATNVFTSWATLYAACKDIPGGVRVSFDDALGAIAIPAGAYVIDGWTWDNGNGAAVVTIDDGAHATWRNLWINGLTVTMNGTTAFFTSTAEANLYVSGGAVIESHAAGAFIDSDGGGFVFVTTTEGCSFGDGVHATFTATNGATFELFMSGGTLAAGAYTGVPGATATFNWGPTTAVPPLSTLTDVTFFYEDPPNGAAALQIVNGANATILLSGGVSVQRSKSGKVQLDATTSCTTSGAATVTGQFVRDGVPLVGGPQRVVITSGAIATALNLTWEDTLPDNAAHVYNFQASATAGTLTSTAGQGAVRALEL